MKVPFLDLVSQQNEIADEVLPKWQQLFATSAFIGGQPVDDFESEFAAYCGVEHAVGVANGTDAIELALRAVGVEVGGEVILPANTFIATAEAVSRIGAIPVLVDVDPVHLLIDPDAVVAAITQRTQAIVPVHLYGQVAPVERILQLTAGSGIPVIEDNAQAQGSSSPVGRAGSLGTIAATSFYPGKNLGAAGDAGAVTTNDPELAHIVRSLGAHGSTTKYVHDRIGVNSRLDAIQAVVLSAKLRRLDDWNARRRAAAEYYWHLLSTVEGVTAPTPVAGTVPVWHLYVVQVDERERVLTELAEHGVSAAIHYPTPLHLTEAYSGLGLGRGSYRIAEDSSDRILSLPMFPHITRAQQEYVVEQLAAAVARSSAGLPV
ncbi:DegT/DnrJ/EryC1/StrS family aminotransferase [Lacisediminihabitans changchengi]|uniref:DegT/DnrJ/EryC1/StrS family aminotransferase n=1 Tax=Lacisediminihabitans changchengi TaxID=2787634 RepID=A0A934SKY0_9MICO|nr:DegT/DnrJ/EryC1/StrS family aminotransferase [Lacisediminihabitans changchengi]MBK4348516.1 DegT/DnrJ/EryC1/StrS family aminotransferase [Lacisediminihabitans changchengi]